MVLDYVRAVLVAGKWHGDGWCSAGREVWWRYGA